MKTIYILLGKRGAGKSFIGNLIQESYRVPFIQVEPFFINATNNGKEMTDEIFTQVWNEIRKTIESKLVTNDSVCFESMGVYDSYLNFEKQLFKTYIVKRVLVRAEPETSLNRVKTRDIDKHVPMNEEDLLEVNKHIDLAVTADDCDFVIENKNGTSRQELLNNIQDLIG